MSAVSIIVFIVVVICEYFAMFVQVLEVVSAFFGRIGTKTFVVLYDQLLLGEDVFIGVVTSRFEHFVSPMKILRSTVELQHWQCAGLGGFRDNNLLLGLLLLAVASLFCVGPGWAIQIQIAPAATRGGRPNLDDGGDELLQKSLDGQQVRPEEVEKVNYEPFNVRTVVVL
jgi:hypothetical protein